MGLWAEPQEIKDYAQVDNLKRMETRIIEKLYIQPAERIIEEVYRLYLNDDGLPISWAGRFEIDSELQADFEKDCKLAVILLVNRMAANPHGIKQQTVGGATAVFPDLPPPEVDVIMHRWARNPIVFR